MSQHWKLLFVLFVMLLGAAGCQSSENAPVDADEVGAAHARTTIPATIEPPLTLVDAPDLPSADIPLSQYLRFGHITTEDGLSNNAIWGVAQDRNGFMWIGTYFGLNRYDGSGVKVYHHVADDPYSLSADSTRGLITDQNGVLWVGTWDAGLNEYDETTDRFTRYQHDPDNLRSLSHNGIRSIYVDRTGSIWVGTLGGLNKLDAATKQFTRYLHDPDDPEGLGNNIVWAVYEDQSGIFWIGTDGGLDRFDPQTETFTQHSVKTSPDAT